MESSQRSEPSLAGAAPPPVPSAPPQRRPFAAGDYLTRYREGQPYRLRIESPIPKVHWKERVPGDEIRPPFPGTPILFEDCYFEVVRVDPPAANSHWSYYLETWDDAFPLRQPQAYTEQECHRLLAEYRTRQRNARTGRLLRPVGPILALLPASDQRHLEDTYGIPAARNTLISSLLIWIPATAGLVLAMASSFGGGLGASSPDLAWAARYQLVFWYFFFESGARFFVSFKLQEPKGSFPVWFPVELYRAVRRALDPERRRARRREAGTWGRKADLVRQARDEVRKLQGQEHDLEIVSLLPKPHWTANQTGIQYGETWYFLRQRETLGEGRETRYRFLLQNAPQGSFFRSACEYEPEEVRELYRQKLREDKRTWVDTFAPLWGFLDPATKERLHRIYGFDSRRNTRWSLILGGTFAAACMASAGSYLHAGVAGSADVVLFLLGSYLALESFLRFQKWSAGRDMGSLLGWLLKPLARRLVESA